MMSPGSVNSPYYNPSEHIKTPYSPRYEPNYESNYGIYGQGGLFGDQGFQGTPGGNYSPTESMPSKSPFGQGYGIASGSYNTPQSPIDKYTIRGYQPTSGVYPNSSNPHYSPTTPHNADYLSNYSVRTSNYSGSLSPKIQDSGSSAHSSQNYSPRSPTYNPKSPSYNLIQSSNILFNLDYQHNSPFYNPNLIKKDKEENNNN
jgi:hypothetical protein